MFSFGKVVKSNEISECSKWLNCLTVIRYETHATTPLMALHCGRYLKLFTQLVHLVRLNCWLKVLNANNDDCNHDDDDDDNDEGAAGGDDDSSLIFSIHSLWFGVCMYLII